MNVTIEDGVGDGVIIDTFMDSLSPAGNYGSNSRINLGNSGAQRILIGVDLTGYAGATVTASKFSIHVNFKTGALTNVNWYRVKRNDWEEAQATHNNYKTGTPWTTAGCDNTTDDRESTPQNPSPETWGDFSYRDVDCLPVSVGMDTGNMFSIVIVDTTSTTRQELTSNEETANNPYFYMEYIIDVVTGFWYHNKFIHTKDKL